MQAPAESDRPSTSPLAFEDNIRRAISAKLKSTSRSLNPRVIDLTQSTIFPHKSPRSEHGNSFQQTSFISEKLADSSRVMTPPQEEPIQPRIQHRNSQTKVCFMSIRMLNIEFLISFSRSMLFNILSILVIVIVLRKNVEKVNMAKKPIKHQLESMNIKVHFRTNMIKQLSINLNCLAIVTNGI